MRLATRRRVFACLLVLPVFKKMLPPESPCFKSSQCCAPQLLPQTRAVSLIIRSSPMTDDRWTHNVLDGTPSRAGRTPWTLPGYRPGRGQIPPSPWWPPRKYFFFQIRINLYPFLTRLLYIPVEFWIFIVLPCVMWRDYPGYPRSSMYFKQV